MSAAPCRYCNRTPGPLDTAGKCCAAAEDVAALYEETGRLQGRVEQLEEALRILAATKSMGPVSKAEATALNRALALLGEVRQ